MTTQLLRPEGLPDFKAPPLNEVVLGVQFAPPTGYQQIRAGEVWALFRDNYPIVQEQPPLAPSFETFGLPHQHFAIPQISFASGGTHDRFWFLSPDSAQLIQFQQDRLLHNWRKVGDGSNGYPRFESMIENFRSELHRFEEYASSLSPQRLSINQCEITYINHIVIDGREGKTYSNWLRFVNFEGNAPDDFRVGFRDVIRDKKGKPYGRFICEANSGMLPNGKEIIVLSLSVRGAPPGTNIDAALDFLSVGREVIVRKFAELTTEQAHLKWERVK